jgi:transposase
VIPRGITSIPRHVPQLIEDASNELPGSFRLLMQRLTDHLKELDRQVEELEMQIKAWHHANDASRRLAQIPGIGPITASALVASIGDGKCFSSARQLAAWLGLVSRQHSSGGKPTLLSITKRGDTYLRTLMVHGARAVVRYVANKDDAFSGWLRRLLTRRHKNIAVVAVANRNARIAWALLTRGRTFRSDYAPSEAVA